MSYNFGTVPGGNVVPYGVPYGPSSSSGFGEKSGSGKGCTIAICVILGAVVLVGIILFAVYMSNNRAAPLGYGPPRPSAQGGVRLHGTRAQAPTMQQPAAYARSPLAFQQPTYDQPAPMPQAQLMELPAMAREEVYLPGVPSSLMTIGDGVNVDIPSTENQGMAMSPFADSNFMQDPAMLTPSSATDIQGLKSFMPYMGDGIGEETTDGTMGGKVDPNTGLPMFTPGKLIRSQLLGGYGAGSFLRPVQDPLSGYRKNVGKNLCGPQQARRDIEVRRKQINSARLRDENGDFPVLFSNGEFEGPM